MAEYLLLSLSMPTKLQIPLGSLDGDKIRKFMFKTVQHQVFSYFLSVQAVVVRFKGINYRRNGKTRLRRWILVCIHSMKVSLVQQHKFRTGRRSLFRKKQLIWQEFAKLRALMPTRLTHHWYTPYAPAHLTHPPYTPARLTNY